MDTITIEHSGDGTLVHGTERDDKEAIAALKAAGFKWSRNLGAWFLPRAWGEATRALRVRQLQSALGERVTLEQGALARSGTADDWAVQRRESGLARADRLEARSERQDAEADQLRDRSRARVAGIPFGQPILVGHHSERRHRRALDDSWKLMGKAVETQRQADEDARAAEVARHNAENQENPLTAARRLERNEAEKRRLERFLHGTGHAIYGAAGAATGEYAERLAASIADLTTKIERDKRIVAESGRLVVGKDTVKPGDTVTIRNREVKVIKANPKTVKVESGFGFPLTYPWYEVQGHQPNPAHTEPMEA